MQNTSTDIAQLRRAYRSRPLDIGDLANDPIEQFGRWLNEALAADAVDANAMAVATVGADGQPSLRMVLLKYFGRDGFVFYTNTESRKARELAGNDRAALLFYWPELGRQVRIEGDTVRTSTAETLKYFVSRPRDSQIGAWVSAQSSVISARSVLDAKFAELRRRFEGGDVPLPSFWGGFRTEPRRIEFWQARDSRLHDRFEYNKGTGGSWSVVRLSP